MNENLSFKLLNGEMGDEPHSLLLRSRPRTPTEKRGQFHHADEEFYCLDGDFTFEGKKWFKRGSFVYFPAHYVHGARVHVRSGYTVYLRMSGNGAIHWVDKPKSLRPYLMEGYASDVRPREITNVNRVAVNAEARTPRGIVSRRLRRCDRTGDATSLLSFAFKRTPRDIVLRSKGYVEILTKSGWFRHGKSGEMPMHSYMCKVGRSVQVRLACIAPGEMLVSHGGPLDVRLAR